MKTLTYVDALNVALSADLPEDVKEKLTALRDQTAKRNSAERKPTKAQVQNLELAEVVAGVLRDAPNPLTISEIMKADPALSTLSNQKVTAVVRSMGARVERVADKRVNRFRLAL